MLDILIIEDTVAIGKTVCDFLINAGYHVRHCTSGEDAMEVLEMTNVKLVILDVMLPGMDGFAVCKKIREEDNIPILIISAKTDKEDKINGLRLGADDYIEKPIDIDILLAKIDGIFKRQYKKEEIIDGDLKLDLLSKRAYIKDKDLVLSTKEYELLLLLLSNAGKVLTKEWIFNKIWGYDSFSELQTLTVHIKWLREKIEEDGKNPKRILTVWGTGYRYETKQ